MGVYNDERALRSILKENTAALHTSAERAMASEGNIETPDGLGHFLQCMYRVHARFNHELDHASWLVGLPLTAGQLFGALERDLLSQDIDGAFISGTQLSASALSRSKSHCLGVGYVFEGSALGANVLAKRLKYSNAKVPEYLTMVSKNAKSRWPHYLQYLNCNTIECDTQVALSGAIGVFESIIAEAKKQSEITMT